MLALVKGGMGRQKAHETVRKLMMQHYSEGTDILQLVLRDPDVQLRVGTEGVKKALDPASYAESAGKVVDRVLARLEVPPADL